MASNWPGGARSCSRRSSRLGDPRDDLLPDTRPRGAHTRQTHSPGLHGSCRSPDGLPHAEDVPDRPALGPDLVPLVYRMEVDRARPRPLRAEHRDPFIESARPPASRQSSPSTTRRHGPCLEAGTLATRCSNATWMPSRKWLPPSKHQGEDLGLGVAQRNHAGRNARLCFRLREALPCGRGDCAGGRSGLAFHSAAACGRADLAGCAQAGAGNSVDVLPIHYGNGTEMKEAREDLDSFGHTRTAVWENGNSPSSSIGTALVSTGFRSRASATGCSRNGPTSSPPDARS